MSQRKCKECLLILNVLVENQVLYASICLWSPALNVLHDAVHFEYYGLIAAAVPSPNCGDAFNCLYSKVTHILLRQGTFSFTSEYNLYLNIVCRLSVRLDPLQYAGLCGNQVMSKHLKARAQFGCICRFRPAEGPTPPREPVEWSLSLGTRRVMEAVREGPKSTLGSGKVVALAAGLSVGATVGYIVYRQIKSTTSPLANTEESRLSVPLEVYRTITKYQASFLDLVMQKSGAHVRVLSESSQAGEGEQSSQNSVCFLLQGSPQQVLLARCSLENLAADCETTTDVMEVPQTAFGRIIGRGGESLKLITRTTGARVLCPRERGRGLEKGMVSVTGTRLEVRRAKELILEKVFEDEAVRRRITQSSALRQKRRPFEPQGQRTEELKLEEAPQSLWVEEGGLVHANGVQTTVGALAQARGETVQLAAEAREEDCLLSPDSLSDVSKFEIPSPDLSFQPDEHLEVYVSASENPRHFWIQILGVRSLQLDKLTAEMSRFYSNDTLQEQRVETIVVGDIVAAPYRDYGTWNRARVLGVMGSGLVDLYYVDFGDNGELPRDSLRSMRSDFLSLPFQAIECSLAGVNPAGEVWSDQSLDDFERLTYVAEWRPLLAKLCSYTHSEVSSWPSVQLYDNTEGKAVDLGEEMVRLGHAVPSQDNGNWGGDRDDPGTLQRMLDDVTGATSELSLSCISLSEVASISGSVDDVLEDEFV